MDFGDLKRKKHDDGNKGKGPYRGKQDEEMNPFRKAKKKVYDKETDTAPVEEEGSDLEEMVEGEAGHTAEEKMGEGDHDVEDGEPIPAFLEKEDEDDAEEETGGGFRRLQKKKAAPAKTFSFKRYL